MTSVLPNKEGASRLVDTPNEGVGQAPATRIAAVKSIAILPLTNKSPDPKNAYFASGIHEAILNQLVKINAMQVTSRASVLRYAESDKPLSQIGKELNVDTL